MITQYDEVLLAFNGIIKQALEGANSEESAPGFDPDKSSDRIKYFRRRADKIRLLRQDFEEEMARFEP